MSDHYNHDMVSVLMNRCRNSGKRSNAWVCWIVRMYRSLEWLNVRNRWQRQLSSVIEWPGHQHSEHSFGPATQLYTPSLWTCLHFPWYCVQQQPSVLGLLHVYACFALSLQYMFCAHICYLIGLERYQTRHPIPNNIGLSQCQYPIPVLIAVCDETLSWMQVKNCTSQHTICARVTCCHEFNLKLNLDYFNLNI